MLSLCSALPLSQRIPRLYLSMILADSGQAYITYPKLIPAFQPLFFGGEKAVLAVLFLVFI